MSEAGTVIPAQAEIQKNESLEGWQFLPIKDFAHTTSGGTPKRGVAEYYNGDVPWVKSGDLNDGHLNKVDEYITALGLGKSSAKLFKPGTLLIALYGATIGRLSILNFEASTNQAVCGISVSENVDVKYVFYYLLSIRQKLIDQGKGGAQPNINQQIVKETVVPLAPPKQQKRIVAKIEELFSHIDAGIEALKKAKQLLKQYRQSVLNAAVTGELTKEWREANKAKLEPASQLLERISKDRREKWEEQQLEQFKAKGKMPKDDKWKERYKEPESIETEPFAIPNEWKWITLDVLLNNIEAGKSFSCDERPPNDGETGIVKVSAVTWGEFDSNESKTIADKSKINPNYRIHERDFLFSRANTIELVGACVIVKNIDKDLLLSDKILRFVLPEKWKEWVQLCLRTKYGRNEIESLATGNQESMRNISQGNIRKITMPLLPEAELVEMSNSASQKIDAIVRLEDDIDEQLIKAEKNKQSILSSFFVGKL